jgi:ribosomal protein S27AE
LPFCFFSYTFLLSVISQLLATPQIIDIIYLEVISNYQDESLMATEWSRVVEEEVKDQRFCPFCGETILVKEKAIAQRPRY